LLFILFLQQIFPTLVLKKIRNFLHKKFDHKDLLKGKKNKE